MFLAGRQSEVVVAMAVGDGQLLVWYRRLDPGCEFMSLLEC